MFATTLCQSAYQIWETEMWSSVIGWGQVYCLRLLWTWLMTYVKYSKMKNVQICSKNRTEHIVYYTLAQYWKSKLLIILTLLISVCMTRIWLVLPKVQVDWLVLDCSPNTEKKQYNT